MKIRLYVIASFCLLLMLHRHAFAELRFDKYDVEVTVSLDDKFANFKVPFHNDGNNPVAVTNASASCGCTKVNIENKVYAAGEGGILTASIDLGTHLGRFTKDVWVRTDDVTKPLIHLTLTVNYPEAIHIDHESLNWEMKGDASVKSSTLRIGDGYQGKISLVGDVKNFKAELITKDSREYQLHITPLSTDAPASGQIFLAYTTKIGNVSVTKIFTIETIIGNPK